MLWTSQKSFHFASAAEGEAIESFVVAQVPEHGVHRAEALPVPRAAIRGIDSTLHARRGGLGCRLRGDQIRRAHETVRVGGKGLRELGSIVESKRMFETPAHPTQ